MSPEPVVASHLQTARRVIQAEAEALAELADRLSDSFDSACELMLSREGRIIVTGMGKSGHIAHKLAASLASTGTSAYFMHPAEGFHGDLGVIHRNDLLLALSFSGETAELIELLPAIRSLGVPVISITADSDSTLARQSDVALCLGKVIEADRNNLVPTTSTTLTLALGDALAIALMEARNFTPADFAVLHPKGALGKRLTLRVADLLRGDQTNPVVSENATLADALAVITRFNLGGTCVVDSAGLLVGIITDGDVRRIQQRFAVDGGTVGEMMATPVARLMTVNPVAVHADTLAYDALALMESHKPSPIFILPVFVPEESGRSRVPIGMVHLHALVQAGFRTAAE
jgi:arabinose-5-phosphate isomerase